MLRLSSAAAARPCDGPAQFLRCLFNVIASVLLSQSTSFAALAGRALDGGAFTLSATASSGLTVSFSSLTTSVCSVTGNSFALLSIGTCTIVADTPTLPEWGAILMGLVLMTLGMRRRKQGR